MISAEARDVGGTVPRDPNSISGDSGVDVMPLVKIEFSPTEHVLGQKIGNGFSITWTTLKSAPDVMADYLIGDPDGFSATVGVREAGGERLYNPDGAGILELLGSHEKEDIYYSKLRKSGTGDHVVFVDNSGINEVGVLGPPINPGETERLANIRSAMIASASPLVAGQIENVLALMTLAAAEAA